MVKTQKRVTIIQKTVANRIVLVTGIPIFSQDRKIEKIINISKDITETNKLESDLKNVQIELDWFKRELSKRARIEKDQASYKSPSM